MPTLPTNATINQGYGNNPAYYSRFGLNLRNGSKGHEGWDFSAPCGSPIVAAHSGVVKYAGNLGNYGNYVGLQAPDGSGTGYAHLYEIMVSVGQQVSEGQQIGRAGSTGNSTGCHLHFNYYRQYGTWIYDDPNELFAKGDNLPYDQAYVDGVVKNWKAATNKALRFLAASEYRVGGLEPPANLDKYQDKDPDDIVKEIRAIPGYSQSRTDAQKKLDEVKKLLG